MQSPTAIPRRTFLTLAGVLPFSMRASGAEKPPVGLELYSVRDALMKDLTGTVRAVAKIGYQVVEFYSPYYSWTPQTATEVRKLMDDLGIRCPSTHNDSRAFTPDGLAKAIELNQILGSRYVVLAGPGPVTSIDGWKIVSDRLNAAADRLEVVGMHAGYHNHQLEWKPVEGQRPMDVIATRTVKDVALQLDVGTCVEVGADPVAWIESHPGRIKSLHCKDWAPGRGYAVLFGEGASPWDRIFKAAESGGGVEYYLVEQEEGSADEQLQRAERCLTNWKRLKP
jgi:sugar phosphate isomerase/epimerase